MMQHQFIANQPFNQKSTFVKWLQEIIASKKMREFVKYLNLDTELTLHTQFFSDHIAWTYEWY